MTLSQPLAAIEALRPQAEPLASGVLVQPARGSFAEALGSAIDTLSGSLDRADALSVAAAMQPNEIADAAVARARADVMLEVAAVTAAKLSGAIGQLLQTQL